MELDTKTKEAHFIGEAFQKIWKSQSQYNQMIRTLDENPGTAVAWLKEYMLGAMTEMEEVLRCVNWKKHKKEGKPTGILAMNNLGQELADVTKYILSMWEVLGFGPLDLIRFVEEKNASLAAQLTQDTIPLPKGRKVLVLDLDGTVADWRGTFIWWLQEQGYIPKGATEDLKTTLMADVDLGTSYPQYYAWKNEFESTGMYSALFPFPDGITTVQKMKKEGVFVVVITARPQSVHKRVWYDTYTWLQTHGVAPDLLKIGAEARLSLALQLSEDNDVILFEDNPDLVARAANSGLRVVIKHHTYNDANSYPLFVSSLHEALYKSEGGFRWVESYTDNEPMEYFSEGFWRKK